MTSVGMAAGIAAAFNAPIAAVTFTLEELIGSLDQTMLSGVIVAAALAAVVEHRVLGSNPIFHVPRCKPTRWPMLFAGLVCAAGLAGGVCLGGVYRFAALAARVVQGAQAVPKWVQPAHRRRGDGQLCGGGAAVLSCERHCRRSVQDADAWRCSANLPVTAMAGFVRAETGGHGHVVFERRLGRHFCSGAVYGRHAGRRGGLSRCDGLPPPGRLRSAPLPWWAWARCLRALCARR